MGIEDNLEQKMVVVFHILLHQEQVELMHFLDNLEDQMMMGILLGHTKK